MRNNPTGAMGLPDYLGWGWRSVDGVPIVCVPGCPAQPDNITEVLLYLTLMLAGRAPEIELDEALRPRWLFNRTVHENCNRAAYYEQGDFATEYGSHKCMVKLGCKGPVARCNVGVRGWVRGRGGCPNVGGICIGCTMPGFPDKYMPFMDAAMPVKVSANVARFTYGPVLRLLRNKSARRGAQTPGWTRPSTGSTTALVARWEVAPPADQRLPYQTYEAGGRPARRYELGPQEIARMELLEDRVFMSWTTGLEAAGWLETLHEFVSVKANALGLVISGENSDTRGDLTWRETGLLLKNPATDPTLVRIDVAAVSLVWSRPDHASATAQVGVISPAFDPDYLRRLLAASATPKIRESAEAILRDARTGRSWNRKA